MKIKKYFDKIIIGFCVILFIAIGLINRKSFVKDDDLAKSSDIDQENIKKDLDQEKNTQEKINQKDLLNKDNKDIEKDLDEIFVDISGLVKRGGVYKLKRGSRLIDLVEKAGGFQEGADLSRINLSIKLKDEMKIHIYKKGSDIKNQEQAESFNDKININKASKEELMTIKGIGGKKADDIIEYRKTKRFDTIDEIKEISGFGPKTFDRIKDKITVQD